MRMLAVSTSQSMPGSHCNSGGADHFAKAVHIPVQQMHETARNASQRAEMLGEGSVVTSSSDRGLRESAKTCNDLRKPAMPPAGLEPATR
jgi:hypothetical protein